MEMLSLKYLSNNEGGHRRDEGIFESGSQRMRLETYCGNRQLISTEVLNEALVENAVGVAEGNLGLSPKDASSYGAEEETS